MNRIMMISISLGNSILYLFSIRTGRKVKNRVIKERARFILFSLIIAITIAPIRDSLIIVETQNSIFFILCIILGKIYPYINLVLHII